MENSRLGCLDTGKMPIVLHARVMEKTLLTCDRSCELSTLISAHDS